MMGPVAALAYRTRVAVQKAMAEVECQVDRFPSIMMLSMPYSRRS